ncbi:hypothetical protein [Ferrovibrio sp.]|uniref:hypothetical protein n=1 Tax=Ferrovibrio sp. TaxID=1917215 RepID=UPI0026212C94|nr:hypothetical protein [Ferrovibrio sp.]
MSGRFYVGLTMAGAISAGAYTGGVFDFLMEALEAWEQRKKALRAAGIPEAGWDVPSHDVVIPVMSGASAGGITGALGLLALADAEDRVVHHSIPMVGTVTTRLPRLYQAWVELPCFVDPAGGSDLLGDEDIQALGPDDAVSALLDTTILRRIVDASLLGFTALHPPRPYLSAHVDLLLTHTNLRGVPYAIRFLNTGAMDEGYDMLCHADRVHYVVSGIGSHMNFSSPWLAPDPARSIDVATLSGLNAVEGPWFDYAEAALGTSAFPAGLSARVIRNVAIEDYKARQWPIRRSYQAGGNQAPKFDLMPSFPPSLVGNRADYVTVDGGVIDNEPFELARWALMEQPPQNNPREAEKAERAVLMIDPFPEPPSYDMTGKLDASLMTVIKSLFPTLKDQARFKPDDIADALDESVFSRFLIAPRRRSAPAPAPLEPHAIACGLLGGFGGFLAKEFRAHDYQLGRLNCYLFLKDCFALPATNTVIAAGYGPPHGPAAKLPAFQTAPSGGLPGPFYQIIPLVPPDPADPSRPHVAQPTAPVWPRVTRADVDTMVRRAKGRADAVFGRLKSGFASRLGRWIAGLVWWAYGKSKVEDFIRWAVLQDLYRRDQIAGPTAGQVEDIRLVAAGLANPAYDYRTVGGIARQFGRTATQIDRALNDPALATLLAHGPKTANGDRTYTLQERKPGWFSQLPGIKQVDEWIVSGKPVID